MAFNLDYYSFSLLLGGFTALLSGLIVFIHDRKKLENQAWFALTVSTMVWSFAYFSMITATSKDFAFLSDRVLHIAAILIPLFYLLVVLIMTNSYKTHKKSFFVGCFFAVIFMLINPTTYFIADVAPKVGFNFAPVNGPLYGYFFAYFCILVIYGIYITFKTIRKSQDHTERQRLKYLIMFTLAASIGGGSVFATTFTYTIPPYGLILFSIYPLISGYAILRHQLFNVKVITTQLLTFILWLFILIRTLFSEGIREQLANGALFVISLILGGFLIRSVLSEVKTREKIQLLADDLEKANERLQELDQQKSEFVSLASHQLRGPLAAVKGYASLILEGDFGPISDPVKEAIEKMFKSTQDLVVLVGDYLDVSRIEQGRMKYDFSQFDLKELVSTVVAELRPTIETAKLSIDFNADEQPGSTPTSFLINADKGKIKQVIGNIIDNAVKYTPKGSIHVWIKKILREGKPKILITISDTGVGIPPEVLPRLFEKFTRAPDANKTNIMGTGLGLYVAKKIIEAHNGRVWAESAGRDKGSSFFVELEGE
ncbi:MAG: ATP-binding protein [Candidatus Pacebacteria bacterium]|nr:ATP-binding protein [Candidatus Paceibacterota bacterium]